MTLHHAAGKQEDASLEPSKAVQRRIRQLSPSFTFEELWEKHRRDLGEKRNRASQTTKLRTRWLWAGHAVLLCGILLGGLGWYSPSVGAALKKIFFIDLFYQKNGGLLDDGLYQIEKQNLGTPTNISVTDKNIQLTVAEVFYDGVQLVINYQVDYLKKNKITEEDASFYYEYDFEGVHPTMMGTHEFSITGDHTFVGTMVYNMEPVPDHTILNVKIPKIGTTFGKWDVAVPISVDKAEPLTKIIHPQLKGTYKGHSFEVEELTLSPVSTQVKVKRDESAELYYLLEDDLQTPFLSGGGMGGQGEDRENFGPLTEMNPHPAYVTLLVGERNQGPSIPFTQREEYADLSGGLPLTLKGADGGGIEITGIQQLEDATVIYYEASNAANQIPFLMFESPSGERISSKKRPVRLSRDSFSYQWEFPGISSLSEMKLLLIVDEFSEEFEKPMKIRIPLDWGTRP
ncbi:DUF4179 domain-containing protein [Paenibacillus sp. OAS669]|uniref:DUF4179 domain-containing protein n=1 Tax=Paenibacillus sp. OAS669 TaxID=2663821 RepID=UPI001788EEA8|nr:DUF4179 domain-containing protein [Paenibacillus sp. OAS669]MBE1441547.1 hypothetical protein [Paenibacillus sp. OAS669]